jgi:hypothetical protein
MQRSLELIALAAAMSPTLADVIMDVRGGTGRLSGKHPR